MPQKLPTLVMMKQMAQSRKTIQPANSKVERFMPSTPIHADGARR